MSYHSYTEGNGPFFIWGERGKGQPVRVHRHERRGRPGVFFDGERMGILRPGEVEELRMPKDAQTVYSDWLWQWNPEKHDALCQKHFGNRGQSWESRKREAISAFLSDYWEKPVQAVTLWQYNNAASGYPVWLIFYREVQP